MASFTPSFMTQRPVLAQPPQARQPENGPAPRLMSSVSTPHSESVRATSSSARPCAAVFVRAAPFMSRTFILSNLLKAYLNDHGVVVGVFEAEALGLDASDF